MISVLVGYGCHGNIDFSKIAIITNFSLNLVSGENFKSIQEKSIKKSFKNLRYGPQKLYRNTLIYF